MPRRKRDVASPLDARTLRLLATTGTRSGLTNSLIALAQAGWLQEDKVAELTQLHKGSIRRKMHVAIGQHGLADTPYGKVVQSMDLPGFGRWKFCHPAALLWYLCTLSLGFFVMVRDAAASNGGRLNIVIYIDELCPGNPFRPERSRTLQACYWTVPQFPQHVLQRTSCWPTFGTLRSTVAKNLGGVSAFARIILQTFASMFEDGMSFTHSETGSANMSFVAEFGFGGWLADEKALKEINSTKGASGTKPCQTCHNVYAKRNESAIPAGSNAVTISCTDEARFEHNTDESWYEQYDAIASVENAQVRAAMQTKLGINVDEKSLPHCNALRMYHGPVKKSLRDWQHTCVGGGVANVEIARFVRALLAYRGPNQSRITLDHIHHWFRQWTLPATHGTVDVHWISKNRLGKHMKCLNSFSGTVLSIVPIMTAYAVAIIPAHGHTLSVHRQCMEKLCEMLSIFRMGAKSVLPHLARLRRVIAEHARLFITAYPDAARPKFHHLFHISDNVMFVGALLSCFTAERKHKDTKRVATYMFRHIDNTVIDDLVAQQCDAMVDNANILKMSYQVDPAQMSLPGGAKLLRSSKCVLPCSEVGKKDIVWLKDDSVGEVVSFWASSTNADDIKAELSIYEAAGGDAYTATGQKRFADALSIAEPLVYRMHDDDADTIVVIRPLSIYR
jgi:hypothetical protein